MGFLHPPRTPSRGRAKRRPPLALELLEGRNLPSATGSAVFVQKAFQDLLHRTPDAGTVQAFAGALDQGAQSRVQVVQAIEGSPEYRADLVRSLYQSFLHRSADPAGLSYFLNLLGSGYTIEQVETALAASPEYFQTRAGGTNAGFLAALYPDLLGRALDPTGKAGFGGELAAGASRDRVVQEILSSPEHEQYLVKGYYQQYLHRPADPAGLSYWVGLLQQGTRDEDVVARFLATDEYAPGASDPPADPPAVTDPTQLTPADVEGLLNRASAASASTDAIIAVVDRGGRVLGVRVEAGVSPNIVRDPFLLTFAVDGALAEARTPAFFANNTLPLTSRTIQFISQSTITQREVDSYPSLPDPNSPLAGPGLVAPVGLGGHFPPNVPDTPPVDLFGIELTNRDSLLHPGPDGNKSPTDYIPLQARFNADPAFIPGGPDTLPTPESYGFVSGIERFAQARGVGTLPGGIPIYKEVNGVNQLVGGIGVFFPGQTGFASAENSLLSAAFNPNLPDRSLEAEYMAFAAVGGDPALGLPVGPLGGVPPVPGINFPLPPETGVDLEGISLDVVGPGGTQGPFNLAAYARGLRPGTANGTDLPVDTAGDTLLPGKALADGWLVLPHAGVGLTAADVTRMILQGVAAANQTRAQIRLPLGSTTRLVFAVTDGVGDLLGLYRMPDATFFSIDVAVAKARNVAYYDNPLLLQPADEVPGLPPGVALTNRTFRYLAQPRFPEGIDGTPPAPFSVLNDPGVNRANGLDAGPPLPASVYQSVYGYAAFHPGTNFHDPYVPQNQNGIVFFPGSQPVYRGSIIVGGLGVSGDGVNQDDVVTSFAGVGYTPPDYLRADQYFVAGVRLPYQEFPRNPQQL